MRLLSFMTSIGFLYVIHPGNTPASSLHCMVRRLQVDRYFSDWMLSSWNLLHTLYLYLSFAIVCHWYVWEENTWRYSLHLKFARYHIYLCTFNFLQRNGSLHLHCVGYCDLRQLHSGNWIQRTGGWKCRLRLVLYTDKTGNKFIC